MRIKIPTSTPIPTSTLSENALLKFFQIQKQTSRPLKSKAQVDLKKTTDSSELKLLNDPEALEKEGISLIDQNRHLNTSEALVLINKGIEYLERAALKNPMFGSDRLVVIALNGLGPLKPEPMKAVKWLKLKAEVDYDTYAILGGLYLYNEYGIKPDFVTAMTYLTRKIRAWNWKYILELALLYHYGSKFINVAPDPKESTKYIETALQKGATEYDIAEYFIPRFHYGLPIDTQVILKWYCEALIKGDARGAIGIQKLFNGELNRELLLRRAFFPENLELVKRWGELAAEIQKAFALPNWEITKEEFRTKIVVLKAQSYTYLIRLKLPEMLEKNSEGDDQEHALALKRATYKASSRAVS